MGTASVDCAGMALEELECLAATHGYSEADLPVRFDGEPYTRVPLYRDETLEVVLICFSSVLLNFYSPPFQV